MCRRYTIMVAQKNHPKPTVWLRQIPDAYTKTTPHLMKKKMPPDEGKHLVVFVIGLFRVELTVNFLHVCDELENLVRVTDLVVVPRNNLNESVGQSDTSLSVED